MKNVIVFRKWIFRCFLFALSVARYSFIFWMEISFGITGKNKKERANKYVQFIDFKNNRVADSLKQKVNYTPRLSCKCDLYY